MYKINQTRIGQHMHRAQRLDRLHRTGIELKYVQSETRLGSVPVNARPIRILARCAVDTSQCELFDPFPSQNSQEARTGAPQLLWLVIDGQCLTIGTHTVCVLVPLVQRHAFNLSRCVFKPRHVPCRITHVLTNTRGSPNPHPLTPSTIHQRWFGVVVVSRCCRPPLVSSGPSWVSAILFT
ncbi:hypothetical protein RRG08_043950 [Elysia crispata]|uniref:Uncharacterized protein n=1 Tax=Elysia crispata TaxID=231223 RepID=A0AAE0Y0B8_9GAST|nr:hypothetical protein RRG08_043950 [Elysia crispata]